MKFKRIFIPIVIIVAFLGTVLWIDYKENEIIEIEFGLFSGNTWEVPQQDVYKIYDEAIKDFEERNPNIKVSYRSGTLREDYPEWLAQKILVGDEPDVFVVVEEDFNTLSSIGMLEDLTGFIKEDPSFTTEDYYLSALEAGKYQNNQYGLPFQIVPTFMIVNKTLLENNGITVPEGDWTWDDFYEICEAVTRDIDKDGVVDQFGVQGFEWDKALYANGQALFDSKGKEIAFTDDALKEMIDLLSKINRLNKGVIVKEHDFDKGIVAFKSFSLAEYRVFKPYPYRVYKYTNFEWEAIKFPSGPSGEGQSKLYSVQLGMSSRTKEKEAAWEFIKFLTNNEEVQEKVWEYTYTLPANKQVVENIYSKINSTDNPKEYEDILDSIFLQEIIENSIIEPRFENFDDLKEEMDKRLFQIIMGNEPFKESVRLLKKDLLKELDYYSQGN